MRYFLIDKVTELVPGERACGIKSVSLSDEILHDHFPDYPVFPGLLVVEAMAQLGGFLLEMTRNRPGTSPERALLAQVRQAKFYGPTGPGDSLVIEASLASELEGAAQIGAEAHVGERRIARAELTFVLKMVDSKRLHEQRRRVYRMWTREFPEPLEIV